MKVVTLAGEEGSDYFIGMFYDEDGTPIGEYHFVDGIRRYRGLIFPKSGNWSTWVEEKTEWAS